MSEETEVEELKIFIGRIKLKEIRCVHLSFALDETTQLAPNKFEFKLEEKIDYGFNDDIFHFKITGYARVMSDDFEVGNLETRFVFIHDLSQGDEISPETTHKFLGTTGIMIAFPYLREVIQSTMARFGLGGIVLDYMRKPE